MPVLRGQNTTKVSDTGNAKRWVLDHPPFCVLTYYIEIYPLISKKPIPNKSCEKGMQEDKAMRYNGKWTMDEIIEVVDGYFFSLKEMLSITKID